MYLPFPLEIYMIAIVNAMVCVSIICISICRLNTMQGHVLYRVRSEYAAYVGAASFSALQPWMGYWPTWGGLFLASAMLIGLLASSVAWRNGHPPAEATKSPESQDIDGQIY